MRMSTTPRVLPRIRPSGSWLPEDLGAWGSVDLALAVVRVAEGRLTRRLFGGTLRKIAAPPSPAG